MTVLAALLQALTTAAAYNPQDLSAPRVLLWPDEDRQWAQCFAQLRAQHPALWALGDYAPEQATGPAVWLRYQLEIHRAPTVPVLYLPGISRAAFRSAEQCPPAATHLFALQFQGQFWTQKNGKDWTPYAFLASAEGGLGLDVASDQDTKQALQESLLKLLTTSVDLLRGRRLEAADFRDLLTPDPARTLLQWLGEPEKTRLNLTNDGAAWESFCATCQKTYGFDPAADGALSAAEKLSAGQGKWAAVWKRYKEAPRLYPGVKEQLETLAPRGLFEQRSEYLPRVNRQEEAHLEKALLALASASPKAAQTQIATLAATHAERAQWVWAAWGEAPLAAAIGHLRELATLTQTAPNPTTWPALAEYYSTQGWQVDYAVLQALNAARSPAATQAVTAAVRAVYLPWLEKFAALAQASVSAYPATPHTGRTFPAEAGTLYLFADGLRLDVARALEEKLQTAGLTVTFTVDWAALPTVTATAKPAWQPLAAHLGGPLEGVGFQAQEKATGKALTHPRFKQLLADLGLQFLEPNAPGLPTGCAWTEFPAFDKNGHNDGHKLAWRVDEALTQLSQHIAELLQAGWATVKVVTDHGWLMLPGGLPKADLPRHLTESRWGRCALPKPGAQHAYPLTGWFWDSAEAVVLAPGVSCFIANMEYAHGGLTLQEAVIPTLTVTPKALSAAKSVTVRDLKWAGLRLNVVLTGAEGLTVDLRRKVADATSSLASPTIGAPDGHKTSLLVADDDTLGTTAFLVVVNHTEQVIFKQTIVIGEN